MDDNPMMPGAGPQAAGPMGGPGQGPSAAAPAFDPAAAHGQTAAQFQKILQADKQLRVMRMALDGLVKMGDQVQDEDLLKAAGDLTVHGLDPQALAGLLASAPPGGGQALQGWLQQQEVQLAQHEAQLAPMLGAARHQLGIDAVHGLMALHMKHGQQQAQLAAAPPASNQLM